jgi:hypothetical protein
VSPLDLQDELEVNASESGATVTVPLAEPEGDWIGRYGLLARSEGLNAHAEPQPRGVVLRVEVSTDTSRDQVFELLDAAVRLIERAKIEANRQREATLAVDRLAREWWSAQGHSTP